MIILSCAFLLLLQGSETKVLGGPENVLVVRNDNSPVSIRIASYYMAKRNIAPRYLATIHTVDSSISAANESISPDDYINQIHKPIDKYLSDNGLRDRIQYIVLTKGIPIRLSSDPTGGTSGGMSVDSVLATIGLINPIQLNLGDKDKTLGHPIVNRYWRSMEPFSHAKYGGYLVTRLDGYTEADAKALVDRAMEPVPSERIVFLDTDLKHGVGDPSIQPKSIINPDGTQSNDPQVQYSDFNADMIRLSQLIANRPNLTVTLDKTDSFVSTPKPVLVYISWGSNDKDYKAEVYHSMKFAPRSIVETAVSSSGRTFLPATGGQSLIADLIAQGAAGAKGYVTEPYLFSMASPTVLVDLYTSGHNLAESYYAASRFIAWKDIVIGDPLCSLSGK